MKFFKIILLTIFSFNCLAQDKIILLDTINSDFFKEDLVRFYKEKYNAFNSNINLAGQTKLSKRIYLEYQEEFLEKIKNDNFIPDERLNYYAQKLLFEILDVNKLDKKKYKILISRDSEINAYNSGDGTIVINFGLFTALENEDELVFVLCHEIGHQELQHVKKEVDNFVKQNTSEEIAKETNDIKKLKYNKSKAANNLLLKLNYKNYYQRRKKETEADSIGFHYYKKTGRNLSNSISLLNKLNDSNKEKDSITVQDYKELFETETYKLKNKYFEVEKSIFNKYDYKPSYEIDSLKTHPDCTTRIKKIEKFISNQNSQSSVSETFLEYKKYANYQNLYNLYLSRNFGLSLYQTLKEYKLNKDNSFYKDLIFLNLVELQKAKNNQTLSKYVPQTDNIYNSQSLNRFINLINNLKTNDLEIIIKKFK